MFFLKIMARVVTSTALNADLEMGPFGRHAQL